jgi:hypothetical protein
MENNCKYCKIEDYTGELFKVDKMIDGKNQNFEIYILDNIEADNTYRLFIDGTHTSIEIEINYCPICGKKITRN